MSQFQLFPSPSPEAKLSKNPFRKGYKRSTAKTQPSSPIPLEDIKPSPDTEAVLLKIIEDTNNIQAPPKAHINRPTSLAQESQPSRQNDRPRPFAWQSGQSSSSTLVESNSSNAPPSAPPPSTSPVIPMRSMFPRYNPNLPLSQQHYYPQSSTNVSPSAAPRRPERLAMSPPPEIDTILGPLTVPASVMNFPSDVLDLSEIHYSSAAELESLWEAANGQRPQNLLARFNLRVTRTEAATFTFGDPQLPFYTINTYSTNELSITRASPSKPDHSIPIMTLSLEDQSRREPPGDGLITLLFSRLAAMLAIDQAEELAKQHRLAPTDAAEVEDNALKRAAAQESCRLTWNSHRRLYELHHPSFVKQQTPALIGADGIPLSPVQTKYPGKLHITVSTPSSSDSDSTRHQPPTIIVTTPVSCNAVEAANLAATPRTSTLPLTDSDEPLASLDFDTMTLSLSPVLIITAIPSLYAIDSLIAAVLAVAVCDPATNPILADMELYVPSTQGSSSKYSSFVGSDASKRFTGKLFATLAERDDAAEGSQLISKIKRKKQQKQSESQSEDPSPNSGFRFWSRSKPREKKKKKNQVVIEEFDLEKYGRYGHSSSREGEKLPGITRAILRIMFWGLNLLVHGLTLVVKIIAWMLVNMTRCLTSENF